MDSNSYPNRFEALDIGGVSALLREDVTFTDLKEAVRRPLFTKPKLLMKPEL